MKPKDLISRLDDRRIVDAIAAAERSTSGEIRVCISQHPQPDALSAARRQFCRLKMERTKRRNGVLIYFVPHTRQFAVWGDVAVHEKGGDDLWREVVTGMTPMLKEGKYTEAVVFSVQRVGEVLARHFPPDPADRNELPDRLSRDV
jgi:uncharacterized membrane protein